MTQLTLFSKPKKKVNYRKELASYKSLSVHERINLKSYHSDFDLISLLLNCAIINYLGSNSFYYEAPINRSDFKWKNYL